MAFMNQGQPEIPDSFRDTLQAIIDFMKECDEDGYVFVSHQAISAYCGASAGAMVYYMLILSLMEMVYIVGLKHNGEGQTAHYAVLEKNSRMVKVEKIADRLVFKHD